MLEIDFITEAVLVLIFTVMLLFLSDETRVCNFDKSGSQINPKIQVIGSL